MKQEPPPTDDDAPPAMWLLVIFIALAPYAIAFGIALMDAPQ